MLKYKKELEQKDKDVIRALYKWGFDVQKIQSILKLHIANILNELEDLIK